MDIASKQLLMAKAQGFIKSIESMDSKDKSRVPNREYGEDYNNFRNHVVNAFPKIENLMPPSIRIRLETESGWTESHYNEIATYCEQIYQMLAVQEIETYAR